MRSGESRKAAPRLNSFGMPAQDTNEFGRKADFGLLEATDAGSFQAACQAVIQSGKFLSDPIQALLQQARENTVRVVVVEMPMHPLHIERFYEHPIWEQFRAGTRAAVEGAGATYINASNWVPKKELFADRLHLSTEGAKLFSQILATQLTRQRPSEVFLK
jgi:hypothetical protein